MTRVLTNQASTITLTTYTAGTPADQGTFTIGIVDGNGDEVVAPGTAVTDNGDGTYEYELAAQSDPSFLIATWTEQTGQPVYTTEIEVIGSQLFTEFEARNKTISGQQTPLSDATNYPDALIHEWHDRIAQQFEKETGRGWVLRHARIELRGNGGYVINPSDGTCRLSTGEYLNRPGRFNDIGRILSVTIGGTAQTLADYNTDGVLIYSSGNTFAVPTGTNPLNVVIEYEYGVPDDLAAKENALRFLLSSVVPSDVPGWASSWSNEDGTFTRTEAGFEYPTRVYKWLRREDRRRPFA